MTKTLNDARFLISETDPRRLEPCSAEVAFIGRSNAGKSSLINALCQKNLARVSGTPGRTRAINVFEAQRERWLVDLPGYGFKTGPKTETDGWAAMIEPYLTERPSLRMIFILIDAKVGPTNLDLLALKWMEEKNLPWRAVAAKADQIGRSLAQTRRRDLAHAMGLSPEELAWVSARDGIGLIPLRGEISALLEDRGAAPIL